MLERAEQKGSEASLLPIRVRIGACFDEMREKTLRQILRIFCAETFASSYQRGRQA